MHIKTNIELNIVHMVVLAICPIMFIASNSKEALALIIMVSAAFLVSALIASLFNKVLTRNIKIFVTAIMSSMIVTLLIYVFSQSKLMGIEFSDKYYFAALSAIVLSIDIYYIDTRAVVGNVVLRILFEMILFAGIYLIYAIIVEFLSLGSVLGRKLFAFSGLEFFASVPFCFILLGLICAIAEAIYRVESQKFYDRKMAYEKFVKKIRDEKIFQYDTLRRKKILVNEIDVRKVGIEEIEVLKEMSNQNESMGKDDENVEKRKSVIMKKPKKNKKLRVSHEAKVERLFEKKSKEGDDNA